MTGISALWLPILVSAVLVFIASSIIHMAPLWHRSELPAPPDGDRPQSMKDCNTPEFVEKLKRGPVLIMTVIRRGVRLALVNPP